MSSSRRKTRAVEEAASNRVGDGVIAEMLSCQAAKLSLFPFVRSHRVSRSACNLSDYLHSESAIGVLNFRPAPVSQGRRCGGSERPRVCACATGRHRLRVTRRLILPATPFVSRSWSWELVAGTRSFGKEGARFVRVGLRHMRAAEIEGKVNVVSVAGRREKDVQESKLELDLSRLIAAQPWDRGSLRSSERRRAN